MYDYGNSHAHVPYTTCGIKMHHAYSSITSTLHSPLHVGPPQNFLAMQQDNPSTSSSGSRIFIDVRGNPLRVFTETSSVQARPKVVRMLRVRFITYDL